ncbi:MAG: drug/metabolite exporter YedA [Longimicrobiales bacterium]
MADTTSLGEAAPSRAKVIAAFAAVYIIWGSTYLAIRFAIETMPPFLMAAVRFLIAGALLYGWRRAVGVPRPNGREWRSALVVGGLLLLGGNGGVVWAEQTVPSGIAALLVAIVPLWIVLLDWLRPGGVRPSGGVMVGVLIGFAGVALLIGPDALLGGGTAPVDPVGALVLMVASLSWAVGSLYSRAAPKPSAPFIATGMQMLAGGVLLLVAGVLTGEPARLDVESISAKSLLALLYLIIFGAIIGYSAYIWLLRTVPAARAATYAYVNPVVAVLLGWALADEPLNTRTLVGAAIIIGAVALITTTRVRSRARAAP